MRSCWSPSNCDYSGGPERRTIVVSVSAAPWRFSGSATAYRARRCPCTRRVAGSRARPEVQDLGDRPELGGLDRELVGVGPARASSRPAPRGCAHPPRGRSARRTEDHAVVSQLAHPVAAALALSPTARRDLATTTPVLTQKPEDLTVGRVHHRGIRCLRRPDLVESAVWPISQGLCTLSPSVLSRDSWGVPGGGDAARLRCLPPS